MNTLDSIHTHTHKALNNLGLQILLIHTYTYVATVTSYVLTDDISVSESFSSLSTYKKAVGDIHMHLANCRPSYIPYLSLL